MKKSFSSGQKRFMRPYFPLIRGMFVMKSVLRFSFWALEVPELRVRKQEAFSLTKKPFPHSQVDGRAGEPEAVPRG